MKFLLILYVTLFDKPVLLSLSSNVIIKQQKAYIYNKKINWDLFRSTFEETITFSRTKNNCPTDQ